MCVMFYLGLQILQRDWEAILVLILLSPTLQMLFSLHVLPISPSNALPVTFNFSFKLYFLPHITLHTQVLNISPYLALKS